MRGKVLSSRVVSCSKQCGSARGSPPHCNTSTDLRSLP